MKTITELLAMGGFAAYVWPSFLSAALILLVMTLLSARSLKRTERRLSELDAQSSE